MSNKEKIDKLNKEEIVDAAGGFPGKDRYSKEKYKAAGITWIHHTLAKDSYVYNGDTISQKDAEILVAAYDINCRVGKIKPENPQRGK